MVGFDEFIKSRMEYHQTSIIRSLDESLLEAAARHRLIYKELELVLKEYLHNQEQFNLLNIEQVAKIVGVSKSTIYRAAKEGTLIGIQISRDYLFTLSAVLEYKNQRLKK